MIDLAAVIFAVALSDIASGGLHGRPRGRSAAYVGMTTGAVVLLIACLAWAATSAGRILFYLIVASANAAWIHLRVTPPNQDTTDRHRAWAALSILAGLLVAATASSGQWAQPDLAKVQMWLEGLAVPGLTARPARDVVLIGAALAFMAASSNGAVRALLTAAGTKTSSSEKRLRGGRIIGALERWMIFGLMLGGEPTAAALVVSAKSLLRFPELTRVAQTGSDPPTPEAGTPELEVDLVTEYFLLGSLASWGIAMAFAAALGV